MSFLEFFGTFFTTNYDPLLYLFLLKMKKRKGLDDTSPYYRKIVQINKGVITVPGQEDLKEDVVLLHKTTQKMRYDISNYIIPEEEKPRKGREKFYAALNHIERGECGLDPNDGFGPPADNKKVEYMEWQRPEEREDKDNMFYLHGGLFIYKGEGGEIRKTVSSGEKNFVKYLLDLTEPLPLCVFEARSSCKKDKIEKNDYLHNCLNKLGSASGNLCIVGWSGSDNDQHLVDCINKNSGINTLLVSYYRDDGEDTVKNYMKKFPDKEIIFWDVGEAPFERGKINEEKRKGVK